jgi:hypothetical protein
MTSRDQIIDILVEEYDTERPDAVSAVGAAEDKLAEMMQEGADPYDIAEHIYSDSRYWVPSYGQMMGED